MRCKAQEALERRLRLHNGRLLLFRRLRIELTHQDRGWSARNPEVARGEVVRAMGAHSSSPRRDGEPRRFVATATRSASRALSPHAQLS